MRGTPQLGFSRGVRRIKLRISASIFGRLGFGSRLRSPNQTKALPILSDLDVGLDNHQHQTPASPKRRQPFPENAGAPPQPCSSLPFGQQRKPLPQSSPSVQNPSRKNHLPILRLPSTALVRTLGGSQPNEGKTDFADTGHPIPLPLTGSTSSHTNPTGFR